MAFASLDFFDRGGPSPLRKNLRIGLWEAVFATPYIYLYVGGNIILAALLTQIFQIGSGPYGLIVSLPALCNSIQFLLVPLLARVMSPRWMTLGFGWMSMGLWLAFTLALPWIPVDDPKLAATWMVVFLGINALLQALVGVGWTSWVQEWVPRRLRGKYFGLRNRWAGYMSILFILLAGEMIGWMDGSVLAYQGLFLLVALMRFFSLAWQHRIQLPDRSGETMMHVGWWKQLSLLGAHPSFVRLVVFGATASFLINLKVPFGPVYLYQMLQMTVGQVSLLAIIASLFGALTMPLWGRLSDRYGCKSIIIIGLGLWASINLFWWTLTPLRIWPLYLMWMVAGIGGAGFGLGWFNLILKTIPPEAKTAGISLNTALVSLAAGLAPILMGQTLQWVGAGEWIPLRTAYLLCFTLAPAAVLLSLLLLRKIEEPESDGMNSVLGAMRTARQILVVQGLTFLTNVAPVRLKRKR